MTGTCRHCGTVRRVFLYDAKAEPPWWYLVSHLAGGLHCHGSGRPAVEQEQPCGG
jgi:hypothetical protein